jgi:hypothetical protein
MPAAWPGSGYSRPVNDLVNAMRVQCSLVAHSGSLRSACPTAVRFTCSNRLERIERGPSRGARFKDRCWHPRDDWLDVANGSACYVKPDAYRQVLDCRCYPR